MKVQKETPFYTRNVIGDHMCQLAEKNEAVVVVTADLAGTCRLNSFVDAYPQRFFNVGVAEQNMVSFAAGLAHEGFIPYVFSMAPFISMRACEQCRTDVAYAGLNVRLVAPYSGYSGGISGATHWALEDCAIMGSIAGMTVMEPSDPFQAKQMLDMSLDYQGPIYIRNTVEPVEAIYEDCTFEIGKASYPRYGDDGAFICSGVVVQYALEAARLIENECNKKIRVVDMHTFKPIDVQAVIDAAKTGNVIVAQDHNIIGGLGYSVATIIAESQMSTRFKILGGEDRFIPMAHAEYLYHKYGYDTEGLVNAMKTMLRDEESK